MIRIFGQIAVTFSLFCIFNHAYALNPQQSSIRPSDIRCEYLRNPLGIDETSPRLGWKLIPIDPQARDLHQSAYQIVVASHKDLLKRDQGDLWDTGRVDSDRSIQVPYAGRALQSEQECWWKVKVWDQAGKASEWSEPAMWSMGLLSPDDWEGANWIGRDESEDPGVSLAPLKEASWCWFPEGDPRIDAPTGGRFFRRRFEIPGEAKIKRAICFFAADDRGALYVNGTQVGIGNGHPNLIGVDIARLLRSGENVLAMEASNLGAAPQNPAGWIFAAVIEFEDGHSLTVLSGENWVGSKTHSEGWETIDFDDTDWVPVKVLGQAGISPWGIPWGDVWQTEHRRLPARYLRREFELDRPVRRATAYVCGLGFFELSVNDQRASDQIMNPALTGYDKRALYVTFDVTDLLKSGANALGVVLSNGRFFAPRRQTPVPMHTYGYPKLKLKLHLEFEDGTEAAILSDGDWKLTTEGPIRSSNEYDGEEYDARFEMDGWTSPGFDDSAWSPAEMVESPGGRLEAQMVEPIRITKRLKPVQITNPKPGVSMVDFGQAFYGAVQLKVQGPAGTRVSIQTSFNVLPDGTLNDRNDRSALNTDVYTLRGKGVETWSPRFRGNATRWAQIEGFPGTPTADNFEGLVLHTDFEQVGEFSCSNDLVKKIYQNAVWGTRMQNRSVPMEPDRDERMPWSGHPAKTSESEGWVFGVAPFYNHFLSNYREHQGTDGSLQEILPPYWTFNSKDVVWPSVAAIIPDWMTNFYGDLRVFEKNYEMMKRFVLYHEKANLKADDTIDHCSYGDWVDAAAIGRGASTSGATSRPLISTAYFYRDCRIVERAARLLGKAEDEHYFHDLANRVQVGFNKRFFNPETTRYESDTQCADVLALQFDLVPESHREAVIQHLVANIMKDHNGHTSVGLLGNQWQLQTLTDIGHPEVAYTIATRTDRPSWGYMISKGATTIWERWDTDTQDGGMNGESQKILSGIFEAWCYRSLGGIDYDPEHPGFKHIILHPNPVGDLDWVRCSHESLYGKIVSDWKVDGGTFRWNVTVPPNTTATVFVPTDMTDRVLESGKPAKEVNGVTFVSSQVDSAIYEMGSGSYSFSSPMLTAQGEKK